MDIEALYQLYIKSAGVTTDTRQIEHGCIFFALKGEKFNANHFAVEALQKGAAYAVIDETLPETEPYKHRLILVTDVLNTLQQLAGYHRRKLKCPVLAITGSNGKTTTKELIAAVMAKKYHTIATRGNLNNHIGVPLTLLATPANTEFLIVEMGANHQREIAGYCVYADPEFGLITNIGKAHLEGFGGVEGVIKGKTELYAHIGARRGKLFVSSQSAVLVTKASEFTSADHIIQYGSNENDNCRGENTSTGEFLTLSMASGLIINTNLVGSYNFENALAAVCVGKYFGLNDEAIKTAIEAYVPSNNRSQKLTVGTNTILLDAYNANPSSMAEALNNFDKLQVPNKITVLGEMMELGEYALEEHKKIADRVLGMELKQRIFVGDGFKMLKDHKDVLYFENTDALKHWYKAQHFENTTQLIKGSRKNALEKILA